MKSVLAFGLVAEYPAQKAVAFKLVYPRGWRVGQSPIRVKLGAITFPIGCGIEHADMLLRRAFPDANASRLYDEHGKLFCAGSL